MISECVVLASCVMLTAAQLQLPFSQIITLPNVEPMHLTTLPNSQSLMTQSAHSILNQDASVPLNPGILGGVPVLVSEAAQSILDQESRIVGYNVPESLQAVFQQQQQQQQPYFQQFGSLNQQLQYITPKQLPHTIPVTHKDAIRQSGKIFRSDGPHLQAKPQSITIPLLNKNGRQRQPVSQSNVVPVRAIVSLKSLLTSANPSSSESVSFKANQPIRQSVNSQEYFDIPPNHPVPEPMSAPVQSASREPELYSSDDHIVHMRPPPPTQFQSFYRTNENADTANHKSQYRENNQPSSPPPPPSSSLPKHKQEKGRDTSQGRKKPKHGHSSKSSSSNSTTESIIAPTSRPKYRVQDNKKASSTKGVGKSRQQQYSDSDGEFSESSFTTLFRPPPQGSPTYYDNRNNNFYQDQPQGYSSNGNGRPIVHKHIFVHAAPEGYSQEPRVRVIRPPVKQESHVQLIFIKGPTEKPPTQTVVEIPPVEHPKTVVYVLSKKQEEGGQVKVVSPPAARPQAPEIYFIRYGERQNQGYPVPDLHSLNLNENNSGYHNQQLPPAPPGSYNTEFLRHKRNRDFGVDVYAPLMAYASTGQINEITQDEAGSRNSNLDAFF